MYYHNMMLQYEVLLFDVNVIVEEVMPKKSKDGSLLFSSSGNIQTSKRKAY